MDGINDSEVERPGKAEEVMGHEPEEKDGGGWVVVETQRKSREKPTMEDESRTWRLKRLYPALTSQWDMDSIVLYEEEKGTKRMGELQEGMKKILEHIVLSYTEARVTSEISLAFFSTCYTAKHLADIF